MWISVCNWRKFQHYDPAKRRPVWIKNNLDLMSRDEYRDLNAGSRAVLHGIWLEYASSQCRLKFDPSSLSTRLNLRVRKSHLVSLVDAGFIEVVASKSLANGYQPASTEVEVEKKEITRAVTSTRDAARANGNSHGLTAQEHLSLVQQTIDTAPFATGDA